jgi:hypothetical protein
MEFEIDRISPITTLLDEVFYQSTIRDMRAAYLPRVAHFRRWLVVSDYCLGDDRTNKVITFSGLPLAGDLLELQSEIRRNAPKDLKHSRTIDLGFVELLHHLPVINISFIFQQDKYFAWKNSKEFQEHLDNYCRILNADIEFWRQTTPNQKRLDMLAKNVQYVQELLRQKKKIRLLCEAFMVSLLGGYVGSLLCRETALTDLCWLSDRDRTNELGENLVRDIFQVTLIDIAKRNIRFTFTSANSDSDEWYADLTRIPDIIAGSIAGFDFCNSGNHTAKRAAQSVISAYLHNNRSNCFIYRFLVNDDGTKVQRLLVADVT